MAIAQNTPTVIEVDDAIVLLLGTGDKAAPSSGSIDGITRLEKLIYLLSKESPFAPYLTEDPVFEPHNFGPFSKKVYEAIDMLSAAGLITDSSATAVTPDDAWEGEEVLGSDDSDPYATRNFKLTERGWRYFQALRDELPTEAMKELEVFKHQYASLALRTLIRYVYQRHPDMTVNSKIRDQVLGREH